MKRLTRNSIRRWLRNGKSIQCGETWYTIVRTSRLREGFALVTAAWEVERGNKRKIQIVTYDEVLYNVNEGDWKVQIQGEYIGGLQEGAHAVPFCSLVEAYKKRGPQLQRPKTFALRPRLNRLRPKGAGKVKRQQLARRTARKRSSNQFHKKLPKNVIDRSRIRSKRVRRYVQRVRARHGTTPGT